MSANAWLKYIVKQVKPLSASRVRFTADQSQTDIVEDSLRQGLHSIAGGSAFAGNSKDCDRAFARNYKD